MDLTPEVVSLGTSLAETLARNTATAINDRVRSLKAANKKDEAIAGLEELVSELISDKAEIARIAQAYQSELVAQRLSAGDIDYITKTVVPMVESLLEATGQGSSEIDQFKPLLSTETVNILQLLGFNFRRAIGEPLTDLVSNKILENVNRSEDLQIAVEKRQQLYLQLALDPEAYERFRELFPG
ncbi:MAG: hypothetical protein ACTIJ6_10330 [Leucobacter sp.]